MLRGVLDVDARAGGGHGPSRGRPGPRRVRSPPPRTVQLSTAPPGPDSGTSHYTRSNLSSQTTARAAFPEPRQPHRLPPLPARPRLGSRNLSGAEKKGSGLGVGRFAPPGARPYCGPAPALVGSGEFLEAEVEQTSTYWTAQSALLASGYPAPSMSTPKAWAHGGPRTGSIWLPKLNPSDAPGTS